MSISLLKRVAAGDSYAVVSFYKLYSPKILPYLSKRLPTHEDAQEVTNDVFLEAIDSISLLRDQNNILAWLYKIAHNKTVDYYRKRKIKSILLSQIPYLEIVAAEINQPEFQFEKNKIRDKIEFTSSGMTSHLPSEDKLRQYATLFYQKTEGYFKKTNQVMLGDTITTKLIRMTADNLNPKEQIVLNKSALLSCELDDLLK